MVAAVETWGRPFMVRSASLEGLLAAMNSGEVGAREHLAYRIPVAYRLLGDDDAAAREVVRRAR